MYFADLEIKYKKEKEVKIMISKEQFLELKHLKLRGVPTTTIAKKIGISVPNANKWLRMDEDAFETYLIDNTPYLEQYRAFILNILKISFFERCVPLARNVMRASFVMFPSEVMCASRVKMRNTSHHFAPKVQYITAAKPQHYYLQITKIML